MTGIAVVDGECHEEISMTTIKLDRVGRSKVGGARPGAGRKPRNGVRASISRTVKLTPNQAAAHDRARGEVPWSTWIVELVDRLG